MVVLGEWQWALPEAEWPVCVCVCTCGHVCVFRTDPQLGQDCKWDWTELMYVHTNTHTYAHAHVHVQTHKARKNSAFPKAQSSGMGTLDLVIISRAVSFDLLLMSVLGSSHL